MRALMLAAVLTAALSPSSSDIFGRPVPDASRRPTIVLYANRPTEDAVLKPLADLSARFSELDPLVIVRIDLRGLPSLFRGFADRNMRSAFVAGLERYREECRQLGREPNPAPERSLYFVPDPDGHSSQAAGLPKGFHEALAIVLDKNGHEVLRAPFPRDEQRIEQA